MKLNLASFLSVAFPVSIASRVDCALSPDIGLTLDDDGTILSALAMSRQGRQWLSDHTPIVGMNYNQDFLGLAGLTVEIDNLLPLR